MRKGRTSLAVPALGCFTARQLVRLCDVAGLPPEDSATYADVLLHTLGPMASRPLHEPPPCRTFLSDDHTPVEYSFAFHTGAAPMLRVLLEPGWAADTLAENGRAGLRAVRDMARTWRFATDRLDELEDLFFPEDPEGPLALWCALELCPGGVPKVKVYLNPAASGAERSHATVREAMRRLGHGEAFAALPPADGFPFLALDLGDWETPRVKVYLRHDGLSAAEAPGLSRMPAGPEPETVTEFFRTAAGLDGTGTDDAVPLTGRPVLTCHAFTESTAGLPSGFTLHIPVRDYARHDGESLERAATALYRIGVDPAALLGSLSAVTARLPEEGVGLIAYLALVHQQGCPPRVTVYISSEAYAVRPPVRVPVRGAVPVY
ncbi:tryptophan dimethylallyltransferase family protein [Streptomyces sp. enrichment culture]|uniref:tryptophan dimethylallyltransferase family protein n=1 Tax=Streptomyces sp. enrichment culture TaxID=1795815 RepID=UPI003F57F847